MKYNVLKKKNSNSVESITGVFYNDAFIPSLEQLRKPYGTHNWLSANKHIL